MADFVAEVVDEMGEVRHGGLFSIAPNLCLERLFLLVATLDRTPVSGASAAYECPLLGYFGRDMLTASFTGFDPKRT